MGEEGYEIVHHGIRDAESKGSQMIKLLKNWESHHSSPVPKNLTISRASHTHLHLEGFCTHAQELAPRSRAISFHLLVICTKSFLTHLLRFLLVKASCSNC